MGHPKRIAALLLAVLIAFSSPVGALAEDPESTLDIVQTEENLDGGIEDDLEGGTVEKLAESSCTCEAPCAEGAVNTECPVCGAKGADLSACKGERTEQVQTIIITGFDNLPDDVREQHVPAGTKPADLSLQMCIRDSHESHR